MSSLDQSTGQMLAQWLGQPDVYLTMSHSQMLAAILDADGVTHLNSSYLELLAALATKLQPGQGVASSRFMTEAQLWGRISGLDPLTADIGDMIFAASAGAASDPLFSRPGQTFALGLYPWDNGQPNHVAAFESWLGAPADFILKFITPSGTWSQMRAAVDAAASEDVGGKTRVWAVPLTATGTTLASVAAGDHDADVLHFAQGIAAINSTGLIQTRVGWEMTGDWYAWSIQGGLSDEFAAAFRRLVTVFRSVSSRFRFCWNPLAATWNGSAYQNPEDAWPGDEYVDYVGLNIHMTNDEGSADAAWNTVLQEANYGINWWTAFAATHGKPTCIPEMSIITDVYAPNIARLADVIRDNAVAWAGYWDSDDPVDTKLSNNQYPTAAASFIAEFGPPAVTSDDEAGALDGEPFSTGLTTAHPAMLSLSNNADGFELDGASLELPAQTWVDGGDNERGVTINAKDTRGLTATQDFALPVLEPSVPWTPAELGAKVIRFHHASDIAQADNSAVASWADRGPNNVAATQATSGNRPAYKTSGRNSKPSVYFDGSNDRLELLSTGLPTGNANRWALVVGYSDTTADAYHSAVAWGSAVAGQLSEVGTYFFGDVMGSTNQSGNDHFSSVTWKQTDRIVLWRLTGSTKASRLRIDGGTELSQTLNNTINTAVGTGYIGARVAASPFWLGHIQCVIFGGTLPTDDEASKLEGWAAWEFGLASHLPSDHPYKSAPPTV